jgi:hypothetical protein
MSKLLFNRESEVLQPIRVLIEEQNHRTLVLWVLDCSARILDIFEKRYPKDFRPREAVNKALAWATGEIKMPVAKRAALDAHIAAKEVEEDLAASAAAHAMGHVLGTVHVETHAINMVIYGLTAFVLESNKELIFEVIKKETEWFYSRLQYWQVHEKEVSQPWAYFLMKEDVPNKEKQLRDKKR